MSKTLLYIFLLLSPALHAQLTITLNTPQSVGGSHVACQSISLLPGFSFKATQASGSLMLKADASVCDPYGGQPIDLPPNQNYIHTRSYTTENGSRYLDQVQYFDGLGRPVQAVQRGITPTVKDLVSLQEYDTFGREDKAWLPAVIDNNNGAYVNHSTVINGAKAINTNNGTTDQKPYSMPVYENSPLNRIQSQYGPGANWHKTYGTDSKAIRTEYKTNISADAALNCIYYSVSESSPNDTILTIKRERNYETGQLYVTRMEDEDGNASFEFKDKLGQVVLTRQLEGSNVLDTYYVYDDFGNLRAVLPPLLSDILKTGTSWNNRDHAFIRDYAYLYKYDSRNRCIAKRLPGTNWLYYVYDKTDRLIFTQDGEQRGKGEWTFSIPDDFGRIVLTGLCKTANNATIAPGRFDTNVIKADFSTSGLYKGYNLKLDASVLALGNYAILSANYYDSYQFRGIDQIPATAATEYVQKDGYGTCYGDHRVENKHKNKGLMVGSLTAQFNSDGTISPDYLYSVMYYDNKKQIVQTKSTNHLGGIEEEYIAYNFTGQPVKKMHVHTGANNNPETKQTEVYSYQYDHAGRLYNTKHSLNGQPETYLVQNRYDELGRLAKQGTGQQAAIPQSQPMLMAMGMPGAEEQEGESVGGEESTGGDGDEAAIDEPSQPVKATEFIGSLTISSSLSHSISLYANRALTPDFQFVLQQSAWVTFEHPYSSNLGNTIITFFSIFNGVYHDMAFADDNEEDLSTSTTRRVRYYLGAGTYNFNIYNPLVYDPNGTKYFYTTITLSASDRNSGGNTGVSILDPNKEIETMGSLAAGGSLSHTSDVSLDERWPTYLQFVLEEDADVTVHHLIPNGIRNTDIKFYRQQNGEYILQQDINKVGTSDTSQKTITAELTAGSYVIIIYDPTIGGNMGIEPISMQIHLSASKDNGGGTTPPPVPPGPNPDPDPYHPVNFTVTPLQVVEYDYNVRSWTTAMQNDLYSQQLQYGYTGNIIRMDWQQQGQNNNYTFAYDQLSRLKSATYSGTGKYGTTYTYDKHGNIKSLTRNGKIEASNPYGEIDKLTMTHNGNQLARVVDNSTTRPVSASADFKDYSNKAGQYTYNRNGAMNKDTHKGILGIAYNSLNLPTELAIKNINTSGKTYYTYSASGVKLRVVHKDAKNLTYTPVMGTSGDSNLETSKTTDYVGNIIYENGGLKKVLVDGGYIENNKYHYYLKDHLGNNRAVIDQYNTLIQSTQYYPFGMAFADGYDNGTKQPYKYNGKELDQVHGLNLYDYAARHYDGAVPHFTTVDPAAEMYYSWSPYVYCLNNPLLFVDENGMWPSLGDIKKKATEVVNVSLSFISGATYAAADNAAGGHTSVRQYGKYSSAKAYNLGQDFGDAASVVYGAGEMMSGATKVIGGIAGAPETVGISLVVTAAGALEAVHGVFMASGGIKNLGSQKDRVDESSDSGSGSNSSSGGEQTPEFKKAKSGSGKEKATDSPDWAKGNKPYKNESGKDFAKRLMEEKYGKDNYKTGPDSEYNKIKKWGDRGFE